jgi:murein L,D-transpeptidase YafK
MVKRIFSCWLLVLLMIGAAGLPVRAVADSMDGQWKADHVLVVKGERKLHLLRNGIVLRSFDISLGKNPLGAKMQEGDLRTPEGDYVIDWRNPDSDYYLSMHISYPGPRDIGLANRKGLNPGSMIMIHGLPNDSEPTRRDYLDDDWTDGCIAVSNQAMIDIWLSVADQTPITIRP